MKKARKGLTLVEIIVAIAVFSIVSIAFFTSYVSMNKVVARQEEYTRFEMICYDINYYWDMYDEGWDDAYFLPSGAQETPSGSQIFTAYFDKDFEPQSGDDNAVYKITYSCDTELTIIKIEKIGNDKKVIVENVKCGKQWEKGDNQ